MQVSVAIGDKELEHWNDWRNPTLPRIGETLAFGKLIAEVKLYIVKDVIWDFGVAIIYIQVEGANHASTQEVVGIWAVQQSNLPINR